jgi:hypothetical protein
MKYGWKIDEIERRLAQLPPDNASGEATHKRRLVYEEMLKDYKGETKQDDCVFNKSQFLYALDSFDLNIYDDPRVAVALHLGSLFCNTEFAVPYPNLPTFSDEQVIDCAKKFISQHNRDSQYFFKKIVADRTHIQFLSPDIITGFLGKSYILQKNEFYIAINSLNGIQDTITMLHEGAHIESFIRLGTTTKHFAELPAMTREHYAFDFLSDKADYLEINKIRAIAMYSHLSRAIRIYEAVMLMTTVKSNPHLHDLAHNEFETFSTDIDIPCITKVLTEIFESELEYIQSFVASLEIYLNSDSENAAHLISMYQSGIRKLNYKVVDKIAPHIMDTLCKKPFEKQH